MASRQTLENRRDRAITRAITRTVQHPHSGGIELVAWLRDEPLKTFDTELADIRVARHRVPANEFRGAEDLVDYLVDGVRNTRIEAVDLIQDRYGVTHEEAEGLLAAADVPAQARPYQVPSSVTPIGGAR